MKNFSNNIVFFIIAGLLCDCIYASPASDSLPPCILKMKQKDSLLIVDKYDYKGQRWFGISKKLTYEELKKVYFIKTTLFYNSGCNPVATWRTGGNGIVRVDDISPDTIDKTKIIKVNDEKITVKLPEFNSLPPCILQMKQKDSLLILEEYNYKGLLWFSIRNLYVENKMHAPAAKLYIRNIYNKDCKLVCTWTQRGIPRLNNVTPDTVQKEMIIKIIAGESSFKTKYITELPAAIEKLANKKNSLWIEQRRYVYRFQSSKNDLTSSDVRFGGPYYDSDGKETSDEDTGEPIWWHEENEKYRQTIFRPGYK